MPQTAPIETSVWPPMPTGFLKPAKNPLAAIEKAAYKGQPPSRKKWQGGYQHFFAKLPVLSPEDPLLQYKVERSVVLLTQIGAGLAKDSWVYDDLPLDGEANRTIIAIEDPETGGTKVLVVNKFGNGFKVPMHGHATGLFLDQMIIGKMKENHYRLMPNGKARIVVTTIAAQGNVVSGYTTPKEEELKYEHHLHSLEAVGPAISFHYIEEYPRDGKGNGFPIEHFHEEFDLSKHVKQISTEQAMYLQKGNVVLVRSGSVPEYGDHYIVVTGHAIPKPHGMRVQEFCLDAPGTSPLLDAYVAQYGVTLLQLSPEAQKAFHEFHGIITTADGEIKHL